MQMARMQAVVALLVTLLFWLAPSASFAQPKGENESPKAGADKAGDDDDASADTGDDDDDDDVGDDDDDDDDDDDASGGAHDLDELCKIDPANCVRIDMNEYAQRDVRAEMYAVQQIWALRAQRVEVNPYFGLTMNDQFVSHPGPGLAINYYIINPLAIGANFNWYGGMNSTSSFNFETSRAARIGQPITEYQFNVNGNITYVPAYGKFAAFQDFIFNYDFYLLASGGIISTRPIAVVDPDNRTFDYTIRPTWGFGGGMRIFFTRYLAAMLEIHDYMFIDDLENPAIANGFDAQGNPRTQDKSTWLADETSFTNNVQAQLGISVFLPFSWEYRLPK